LMQTSIFMVTYALVGRQRDLKKGHGLQT
jgi:hypothetical protein